MKKAVTLLIVATFGIIWCFPQSSDSSVTEPGPDCQASFWYYFNDSIKTFVEAYPYNFVDQSYGNVVKWSWDFGDGESSQDRNPLHFYSHAGDTVTVCLTTTTADSCESSFCSVLFVGIPISPPLECKTDFTVAVMESYPPIYNFIPDTFGRLASCFWQFGDGSFSYEISPSHRYEYGGNYMVCLSVTYANGCSASKCDMLQAIGYNSECKASWIAFSDVMINSTGSGINDTSFSPIGSYYYFQDQSKGNVILWNWNFGDGTGSNEQNPQHVYNQTGIYDVCLEIVTADSCTSSYCDSLYVGVVPYCNLTGTVKDYTGLDGCGLLIVLDNGEVLEPAEIIPNFLLKDGQRVRLGYTELTDHGSICMAGKIVRIDCIGEITVDSCRAAFDHYSLPWVSSWPPIYQFTDISDGMVVERTWDLGDGTITNEFSPVHRYEYSGYYNVCLTIFTADMCSSTTCETSYYEGANPQTELCDNYIKLNTEVILNGLNCNGSATASLVDLDGNDVYAAEYLWSTGETGPVIYDLCPGMTYSILITDDTGCAVSGSFSFGRSVVYPDSLFGYWNFQQDDMDFVFNLPVFSDSVYCEWDFGDGYSANGSSVRHTYSVNDDYTVMLKVYDLSGYLLSNQEIIVSPGEPTGIQKISETSPEVYPVPATDVLYVRTIATSDEVENIEILTTSGQIVIGSNVAAKQDNHLLQLDVSGLPAGFYIGKLLSRDGSMQSFRFVK
jgi:PKD repeat protein